jgi:hypothetical protein
MTGPSWQRAFLAVSTLVGEPLEVAVAVLGADGVNDAAGDLASTSRPERAAAVARVVAGVVAEIERARLA